MRDVKEVHTRAYFRRSLCEKGGVLDESEVSSPSIRHISSMCEWVCKREGGSLPLAAHSLFCRVTTEAVAARVLF